MLNLSSWGKSCLKYQLDPISGKVNALRLNEIEINRKSYNGFASYEPVLGLFRRLYAIYVCSGRLYFRAGRKTWDITDSNIDCRFWQFGNMMMSGLSVKLEGHTVHRVILLHPNRAIWPFIDPTYDGIDVESDHFLLFLRQNMVHTNWRNSVLVNWSDRLS